MCIVATAPRIASAAVVLARRYGSVTRHAQQRGVSRQRVYREAHWVRDRLDDQALRQERDHLRQRVRQLEEHNARLQRQLDQAVALDRDQQAEVAAVGQARGVSLPDVHALLEVLRPGGIAGVSTLGRWAQAAGRRAGPLLAVCDDFTRPRVGQATADEVYVSDPVLMVVEPDSLCWVAGRLAESVSGAAWLEEFRRLPALEQLTRDAGSGLHKGVALLNAQRQAQGLPAVADQLDHWHSLRGGGGWLRRLEEQARVALEMAEAVEAAEARRARRGEKRSGTPNRCRAAWARAERAMDAWQQGERRWRQVKEAVQLFTPEGQLNTRARAEALLAEALPQLPEATFGKVKRLLGQPETFTYLDEVHRKLAALPVPAEVREAAVQQEGLRRRPEALAEAGPRGAALRGVLLVCAVVLAKAGKAGEEAVAGVRRILRHTWRASSLVECVNSVLRMQQARHRKMSQGLLDLKRLYWNCHTFRTGRRKKTSPYERLGVRLPKGLRWWQLLKMTPEQLRDKLSALQKAG
jgi:hypothetical protein